MEIYMNKKLIAIAIATAVSAPAMAATSNVDVYGFLALSVDSVTNQDAAGTTRVGRASDNVSRIGFKGTEDLGNGLAAVWQIEQAVSTEADTGAGAFGGASLRNTFVGLKSKDMGEVRVGRHDTPYKTATGRFDLFSDTMGDYNSLVGAANGTKASSYFDQRPSNTVAYMTPNFSGFSAAAAYIFSNETALSTTTTKANVYSLAAMYEAGPMYLTAAYEKHDGSALNNAVAKDSKAWKLGAAYSIMDFTLATMYEKTDDNAGVGGANVSGHNTWFVSGKYQMGAIALKAQYAKAGENATANTGAKAFTVGADYGFSKRTTVFALYTKVSNDSGANYAFAVNPATTDGANGYAVSGVSLGVKHSF
jgi:predicted porin